MPDPVVRDLELADGTTTPIVIGVGAFEHGADRIGAWLAGRTVFVLSSPTVRGLWGHATTALTRDAARVVELEVVDGEAAKTVATAETLWREMLAQGGKRDSRLLTLGGGSVGDLGGWVAGCFLRGIEYVQLPTTLLAQVDASVGGKTGVDLPGGKNTVGLFHHPAAVLADTRVLTTLSRDLRRAGLVEVVKMAYLLDPALLTRVENDLEALLEGDVERLATVVDGAVAAKCSVVVSDPREGDRRRLLNFGHTLGHAIEAALGYSEMQHGDAVGWGLLFALRLAERRGLGTEVADRLRRLLDRFDLPPLPELDPDRLIALMAGDKKAREDGLVWVLPRDLGVGEMVSGIGNDEVRTELIAFLNDPFASV
ncbi:MAG: 3-dehydroquinate synthase family protein [Acidobacteriota bacterium]